MKHILFSLVLLISVFSFKKANAQQNHADSVAKYITYKDSNINCRLLQRFAFFVGYHVQQNLTPQTIKNITLIQPFFGKNEKPDSTFDVVNMKVAWIQGGLEQILSYNGTAEDKYKLIYDYPDVPNFTALGVQMAAKFNNVNDTQRGQAKYLYHWFLMRDAQVRAPIDEKKSEMAATWPANTN